MAAVGVTRRSKKVKTTERQLSDLAGVGPATLEDFRVLGIGSVAQLSRQSATKLYRRLCELTHSRQDPCVLDVFACTIAQAKDPKLPKAQCDWWYWSAVRKQTASIGAKKTGTRGRARSKK